MKLPIATRLFLWNSAFFLLLTLSFGAYQIWTSERTALRLLDRFLVSRARDLGVRPPPGPIGRQNGPPPDRQQPMFDFRRPRYFDADGRPLGPDDSNQPFSLELLRTSLAGPAATGTVVIENVPFRVVSYAVQRFDGHMEVVQLAQEMESLKIASNAQWVALFSALPLVLLACAGIAFLLTRLILKPIAQVTKVAERVADNPNERERIAIHTQDEMGRLSTAFNSMTDRLQGALESQTRFTSDAAHELRTPLAGIMLAAENGLHPDATLEEKTRSLTLIDRSAKSMRRLTDLLLSLSRLDTDNRVLTLQEVLVLPIVLAVVNECGLGDDPRLRFQINDHATLYASADALHQILRNLLENASAHTPPEGSIEVSASGQNLTIRDSGEGIHSEHLSRIFDRFYRIDESRVRETGGYGLGLSIVKALCDAQGASVAVTSKIGIGTAFTIQFSNPPGNS